MLEQLRAEDARIDVYAFGIVIIETFGDKPIRGGLNHFKIVLKAGIERNSSNYSHLRDSVQKVCGMCLNERASRHSKHVFACKISKRRTLVSP